MYMKKSFPIVLVSAASINIIDFEKPDFFAFLFSILFFSFGWRTHILLKRWAQIFGTLEFILNIVFDGHRKFTLH